MCPWRPRERPRTLKVGTMGGAQVHPLTPTPPKHFGPLKGGGGGLGPKNTSFFEPPRYPGNIHTHAPRAATSRSTHTKSNLALRLHPRALWRSAGPPTPYPFSWGSLSWGPLVVPPDSGGSGAGAPCGYIKHPPNPPPFLSMAAVTMGLRPCLGLSKTWMGIRGGPVIQCRDLSWSTTCSQHMRDGCLVEPLPSVRLNNDFGRRQMSTRAAYGICTVGM